MNLNFHGGLNGITWQHRVSTVVWLVLTALALGENVLLHCRQGKHRSGVLAMLILGILAPSGSENYDSLEEIYFKKNPKVKFSEWWEWWYNEHGKRITPDRWRLWELWTERGFEEQVQQFRRAPWVHTILQHMLCPSASSCPASSVQSRHSRSRSPVDKHAGSYKKPEPEPTAKAMPRPPRSTSSLSSTTLLRMTAKKCARPASRFPRPCSTCKAMPWRCLRRGNSRREPEEAEDARYTNEIYTKACKVAGVWAKVEQDQAEAEKREARDVSPVPDSASALWVCPRCRSMNTVHNLVCQVATCGERRPLLQQFRTDLGDWFCSACNNSS